MIGDSQIRLVLGNWRITLATSKPDLRRLPGSFGNERFGSWTIKKQSANERSTEQAQGLRNHWQYLSATVPVYQISTFFNSASHCPIFNPINRN